MLGGRQGRGQRRWDCDRRTSDEFMFDSRTRGLLFVNTSTYQCSCLVTLDLLLGFFIRENKGKISTPLPLVSLVRNISTGETGGTTFTVSS